MIVFDERAQYYSTSKKITLQLTLLFSYFKTERDKAHQKLSVCGYLNFVWSEKSIVKAPICFRQAGFSASKRSQTSMI